MKKNILMIFLFLPLLSACNSHMARYDDYGSQYLYHNYGNDHYYGNDTYWGQPSNRPAYQNGNKYGWDKNPNNPHYNGGNKYPKHPIYNNGNKYPNRPIYNNRYPNRPDYNDRDDYYNNDRNYYKKPVPIGKPLKIKLKPLSTKDD